LAGKRFAVWGLAFKPNTDDMRDAPSRTLIADLLQRGATVTVFDPVAMGEARHVFAGHDGIEFAPSAQAACEGADALVIVTEWKEFRSPDFATLKLALKTPLIFDGRNVFDPAFVKREGFEYFGIGRG
jgi:UDPglucose 6-dehydrogenase